MILSLIKGGITLYSTDNPQNLESYIINMMEDVEIEEANEVFKTDYREYDDCLYMCYLDYCSILQEYSVLKG